MSGWDKEVQQLEGLTKKEKNFIVGRLILLSNDIASQFFDGDDAEAKVDRLRALLEDGELISSTWYFTRTCWCMTTLSVTDLIPYASGSCWRVSMQVSHSSKAAMLLC